MEDENCQLIMEEAHQPGRHCAQEVPVGAVITLNGEILARAYNQKERANDCPCRLLAIREACAKPIVGISMALPCMLPRTLSYVCLCRYSSPP